ncbi:MAG: T9SS type A sorting domain-containing protein [Bacteroidales bacterium]|nr:T9SS type A sorting domain-containing protein [Bacteroidales bacterium]
MRNAFIIPFLVIHLLTFSQTSIHVGEARKYAALGHKSAEEYDALNGFSGLVNPIEVSGSLEKPPVIQTGNRVSLRFRSSHSITTTGWMALVYPTSFSVEENKDEKDIYVFPNPGRGLVNIRHGLMEDHSVRLFDMSGNMIYRQEYLFETGSSQIDISQLPSGVYILSFSSGEKEIRRKIVKF